MQNISSTIELDRETIDHCIRVSHLCNEMSSEIELDVNYKLKLINAAKNHDVGKAFIPLELLNYPSSLSKSQKAIIDSHSSLGYQYLKSKNENDFICNLVLQHHNPKYVYQSIDEHKEFNICKNILMAADMFDALSSDRPYRKKFSYEDSIYIMREENKVEPFYIDLLEKLSKSVGKTGKEK